MRYSLFCNNCGNEDFDTCPAPGNENYIYTCTTCGRHIILADTEDIFLKADVLAENEDMHDEPYDYDVDELADDFPDIPVDENDPDWGLDDDDDDYDGVMDGACDE